MTNYDPILSPKCQLDEPSGAFDAVQVGHGHPTEDECDAENATETDRQFSCQFHCVIMMVNRESARLFL